MVGASPAEVIERTGWIRSVAGVNPYLTLFSRAGISRQAADAAVANVDICELPSARGCTYIIPRSEFALALKMGQGFSEASEIRIAKKYLGVTDEEIESLSEKVLLVLEAGPKDPAELKSELGDAVRSLGPEGKKRGIGTTLPMVLGRLQSLGEIRRQPTNGRLDQQRYRYARWTDNPIKEVDLSSEEAATMLAERFYRWIGPATAAQFQAFAGLTVKAAKAAVSSLELVPVEEGSPMMMFAEDREAFYDLQVPNEPAYALIASLDGLLLHRREVRSHLDADDLAFEFQTREGLFQLGGLQELHHYAIVDRGRVVGLWEYEVASASIVWKSFVDSNAMMLKAISETEEFIREQLGDARSFSLDSPESRETKISSLRSR